LAIISETNEEVVKPESRSSIKLDRLYFFNKKCLLVQILVINYNVDNLSKEGFLSYFVKNTVIKKGAGVHGTI